MITPGNAGENAVKGTLEFMKNVWSGMPGMVMPTLSVEDLDRKISDLKTVETWLSLNMNMLRSSIQALEVQRATIATLQSMGDSLGATARAAAPAAASAAAEKAAPGVDLAAQISNATAWWGALQDQFRQAVSHAMSDEPAASAEEKPSAEKPASAAKKSPPKKTPPSKAK